MDVPSGSVLRSWSGVIATDRRADYAGYLEQTGLSEYRDTPGNLAAFALFRELDDGRTEVTTVSVWRSRDDIVAFAGDDIEVAKFYPEDDEYLLDRDLAVRHYDVV
jgi:heme-degrading monooxygenase HmoA